jgi:hypothetical protein
LATSVLDIRTSLTSTLQRFQVARTFTDATVAFVSGDILLGWTSGVAIDITIRIGLPQIEQGTEASSVIETTTAAVTRSADVGVVSGTNFSGFYNQPAGTFLVEGRSNASGRLMLAVDDGSMSNRYQATIGSSYTPGFAAVSGGVVVAQMFGSAATAGSVLKSAFAYQVNDFAFTANGGTVQTDTSGALPVSVNIMRLGYYQNNTGWLNGHLRRVSYSTIRVTNEQLQAITIL